jgi:hypothetical protein
MWFGYRGVFEEWIPVTHVLMNGAEISDILECGRYKPIRIRWYICDGFPGEESGLF